MQKEIIFINGLQGTLIGYIDGEISKNPFCPVCYKEFINKPETNFFECSCCKHRPFLSVDTWNIFLEEQKIFKHYKETNCNHLAVAGNFWHILERL